MRLKSLEIKGFKSFGNPTTLYFDENVTGVVGPNGSGKSNVVDAFRWVLGEQKSKELRLEQMGDVLFNGAAKKQQANLAEVSITFDNSKNILPTEYNTVKITRALYRSGESEYRINDVACRLKDIHILLMDTGIGSNSYSIIELGMVDDILSDKENARRRMFEQAAGISKFKRRKKETLQKLKLTNADLERIEDLLFEIEKNLKDLEKQAKRTKRYFEIKEKYKESSVLLYKLKWDHLESGVHTLNQQIEEHKTDYQTTTAELNKKEAILEEEKRKNLEGEKNLSVFQKNLNELLDQIRRSENEKNLLSQKIQFSKSNIDLAKKEIEQAVPELENTKKNSAKLREDVLVQEKLFAEEKTRLDVFLLKVEEANKEFQTSKDFQQEKAQKLQLGQNAIFELDKKIAVKQNQVENLRRSKAQNEEKLSTIEADLDTDRQSLIQVEEKQTIISKELEVLHDKEVNRQERVEELQLQQTQQKDLISKENRKLDALANERNLLQSMVENLEGFSESVKFLHNKWEGQKVMLSDVINTEEKYRAAVEQVLHPYLNYFIVRNIEEAKSAITLLKKTQKGKGHFFLLDEIQASLSKTAEGSLASVIEVDEKYRKLIDALCGQVLLVDDNKVLNANNNDARLISLNGDTWKKPGEIIGGSVGLFEGKKIGRKKRIEQLDKEIRKVNVAIEKKQAILQELQKELEETRNASYSRQIQIKSQLKANTEREFIVLKSKIDNTDETIRQRTERIKEIRVSIADLEKELEDHQQDKAEQNASILVLKQELSSQDSSLDKINTRLSDARAQYNEQNIRLIQAENHLGNLKKDLRLHEQKIDSIKQGLFDAQKTLERQQNELRSSEDQLVNTSEGLKGLYEKRDQQKEDLSQAEQEYFKARSLANEVEDEIRQLSKKLNNQQFLINQLKDKLTDYKFKKNSIKERLSIEFEYKISDLLDVEVEESVVEAELELQVEKYKRRLDNYGEINPMALEAYDEMEQRFIHITEQRDDIETAKVSLINTISEIEETATQLFLDSFNEVRKHFVTVFRSLFTKDDDCDLVLLDEDDPLNSKIEIIAKPKGKRPKSLSQLSGGEKTLTATALLFSLYLLKPAPFCIFDEVDAPLDDTNIQKFANIIRAFADKSQFIIVTHNKATMAEVDVLYGVYMQKKGISSVSAVDFRNYDEKGTVANVALGTY